MTPQQLPPLAVPLRTNRRRTMFRLHSLRLRLPPPLVRPFRLQNVCLLRHRHHHRHRQHYHHCICFIFCVFEIFLGHDPEKIFRSLAKLFFGPRSDRDPHFSRIFGSIYRQISRGRRFFISIRPDY